MPNQRSGYLLQPLAGESGYSNTLALVERHEIRLRAKLERAVGGLRRLPKPQNEVRGRQGGTCAVDADGLDLVGRVAQARRVNQQQGYSAQRERGFDQVAGRPRRSGGDRGLAPGQCIEQARLSGVGRSCDHDSYALPEALRGGSLEPGGEFVAQGGEPDMEIAGTRRDIVVVRKVERGLDFGRQRQDVNQPDPDLTAECAAVKHQRGTALRFRLGLKQ